MCSDNSSPKDDNSLDNNKVSVKCCFCKSKNFVKWGKRKTENRGFIQTYKCLDCGKRFTNDEGFYRMRNSEAKITSGIDLYFSNLSSRKVRNYFKRHLEHNSSHVTILDWCRRYTLKVQKFTEQLQPVLGEKFYADDTEIDCENRKDHFWVNVDWQTRFIQGIHYSTLVNFDVAREFLTKAISKGLPKSITTDAAVFYPSVFQKMFYSNRIMGLKVEHNVINTLQTKKYNVRIETVFSKIKSRVNLFRGLKALWSAPILLDGIILQHNFIEMHTTLNDYPCERAGLKLDVGQNRWLGFIRLSSQ
jgi:transposase-like protein